MGRFFDGEIYPLVMTNIAMENHHFLIGKPSINGPFSMAMLNNQMVDRKMDQMEVVFLK